MADQGHGAGVRASVDVELRELYEEFSDLRKRMAAARRRLGPEPVPDYTLTGTDGRPQKLSTLFGGRNELLVVHNMGRRCPYCTMWADGLNGLYNHIASRAAFVVVTPDAPAVAAEFARSRGWRFPVVSSQGSTFTADLGFGDGDRLLPGVSSLVRRPDGTIERVARDYFGPGDDYNAAWHLFELLPDGPGEWEPDFVYGGAGPQQS